MQNIYEGVEYFLVRINAAETNVDEPVGWNAGTLKMQRDKDAYGFNYDFIDPEAKLLFEYVTGGGNLLVAAHDTDGGDASAELEFGLQLGATRQKLYLGTINLNDLNEDEKGVTATVEKTVFESKLRTRYDTKAALNAVTDYDGNPLTPASAVTLHLHSKEITKITKCANDAPDYEFLDPNFAGSSYGYVLRHYIQPDTQAQKTSELNGVQSMPFAILDHSPFDDLLYQYKAVEDGHLEIFFSWYSQGGTYHISTNTVTSGIDGMFEADTPYGPNNNQWNMYVWLARGSAIIQQQSLPAVDAGHSALLSNTFSLEVLKDDMVYVGIEVIHTQVKKGAYTDTWKNVVEFKQLTKAPASTCQAYRIIDLLNYNVAAVTGMSGRVLSDFFSLGGAGYNYVITSGYALRKFDVSADKPVQVDLKTVVDNGIKAIFNTGVGFQTILEDDYMRVEPMLSFFRSGIILIITEAFFVPLETHDKAATYNEVDIGYAKYASDEYNTLDEANTEQSWLLPITTYKAKLSVKSSLIASGASIEIQRREQYKEKPSTSLANDDALFIIACTDAIEYPGITYTVNEVENTITFNKPVLLNVDDTITLSVGPNNGSYSVTGVNYATPNSYVISGSLTTNTSTGLLAVVLFGSTGVNEVFAERNQYFESVDNIISPGTSYNLRLTPHRNFYSFAPLINIGLYYKDNSTSIRNTFSKNNGDATTKLNAAAPNQRLELARQIKENADILLADFERSSAPYMPKQMQFKARLSFSDMQKLSTALRGESGVAEENFGCIVAPDRKGDLWICVVQSIVYNFVNEQAEFIVNKVELY